MITNTFMKLKMFKYFKYSDIQIDFSLNPFMWYLLPSYGIRSNIPEYPKLFALNFLFLFFRLYIIIDDGSIVITNNHSYRISTELKNETLESKS